MSKRICKDDQVRLIMECRQSGLSDYQWCRQNGIHPGTFYNWVSRLRKEGHTFPESESRTSAAPNVQEVVKVDIIQPQQPTLKEQFRDIPTRQLMVDTLSADVFWRLSRRGTRRTIPILPCRECSTAISCSNTSVLTGKKGSVQNRSRTAASDTRDLSLRASWRGQNRQILEATES